MAFTTLFLAHAPDADKEKHRAVIDTGIYKLFVVIIRDQTEAVEVCKDMVDKEGIESILLCPGFTHCDVAEIAATKKNVAVSVARGDGPSMSIAIQALKREGYTLR